MLQSRFGIKLNYAELLLLLLLRSPVARKVCICMAQANNSLTSGGVTSGCTAAAGRHCQKGCQKGLHLHGPS